MNSDLYFDGKQYISSSRAAKISGYANDYIGQLCRSGKLDCKMVGRSWYVGFESLISHKNTNAEGSKNKKKIIAVSTQLCVSYPFLSQPSVTQEVESVWPAVSPKSKVLPAPIPKGVFSASSLKVPIKPVVVLHHNVFFNYFPKLVSGAVALMVAFVGFQFLLETNPGVALLYKNAKESVVASVEKTLGASGEVLTASVFTSIQDFIDRSALKTYYTVNKIIFPNDTVKVFVYRDAGDIKVPPVPTSGSGEKQGMVVVPVDEKTNKDAVIAKIQDSFSDEVAVAPGADGVSGVITPVFRTVSDDEYLYVLVPIKN